MNNERIKEIQKESGYPDSISVQQALLKVWNECKQDQKQSDVNKEMNIKELEESLEKIKGGKELYMNNPMFRASCESFMRGTDPISIFAEHCKLNTEINNTLEEHIKSSRVPSQFRMTDEQRELHRH